MKLGYNFKILRGYLFERANLFKEYIEELYQIKQAHTKDHPLYVISKLLMNSLYGRWGMSPQSDNHLIIHENQLNEMIDKYDVTDSICLSDNKLLISYSNPEKSLTENFSFSNISVSIASAISAYARIHMSQFKNSNKYDLFYSDTDSVYLNEPLDSSLVGQEIGQMKLEQIFEEACFIAPKVYGGIIKDENDNLFMEMTKVKGFKDKVHYQDLTKLLHKDSSILQKEHKKWYKSFEKGTIEIKNQLYTIQATENKRKLIYNNNLLVKTQRYIINSDKEIVE